jgi:hypothetical protein
MSRDSQRRQGVRFSYAPNGALCSQGACLGGVCGNVFPCTEQGIRDAIAERGGPHFFACDGPTTVETETKILIDNDVILDGEGALTVDGKQDHRVFQVENGVETELRGIAITGAVAADDFGGGTYNDSGTLTLTNTVIDGDCVGDITSNGYNIESPRDTCGFDTNKGDQVNVDDPKLGLLQNNGGPTMTHALLPGSVAIDHIPAVDCEVDKDQRDQPRPETGGTMCDVGSVEVQP